MANEEQLLKEIRELKAEVKQLRDIVNMLMDIVMEGEDDFDDIDSIDKRRDRFLIGM